MNDIKPEELPDCTQAMLDALKPEEDLRSYSQIENNKRIVQEQRQEEMQELQKHVKVLTQTLQQLRSASSREAAGWKAAEEHADEMERIQSQNFDLIKKINEQESRLRSLEADVAALESEIATLDENDVESQEDMDKDAIAVGLFRKMGFVPCYLKADGREVQDKFRSLMVRSESKKRSTEFDVDDDVMKSKGITPYVLANQLWLASE